MNFKIGKYEVICEHKTGSNFGSKAEVHGFSNIAGTEYALVSFWVDDHRIVKALPVETDQYLDDTKIIRLGPGHFLATTDPATKPIRFEVGMAYIAIYKSGQTASVIVSSKYSSPVSHIKYAVIGDSEVFEVKESETNVEYIAGPDFIIKATDMAFKPF